MNLAKKDWTQMTVKDKSTEALSFSYLALKVPCAIPNFIFWILRRKL